MMFTREEVIKIIYDVLEATGMDIKTKTNNIPNSPYIEFDGEDIERWIKYNVNDDEEIQPPTFKDWLKENFIKVDDVYTYYIKNDNDETYSLYEIEWQYIMKFRTNV